MNGIHIENLDYQFHYVQIDSVSIDHYDNGISINNFIYCSPIISNCNITDYKSYGISLTNGSSAVINHNQIGTSNPSAESPIGIYLSQVTGPHIFEIPSQLMFQNQVQVLSQFQAAENTNQT